MSYRPLQARRHHRRDPADGGLTDLTVRAHPQNIVDAIQDPADATIAAVTAR
ncbi:hypothetical protein [Leifsonia sp. PS1209]|uniref:hypothetical protein n=1 Tax=Leifsonia sp. PS1209 TaxID=2724914 RepID=UPI001442DF4B|nr:hypothetical protein [Leifsonia sp. PS1209]QIZ97799.1 hypothetical protein HF024_04180 [Leifsonia sp. PS1209]